jgi:hypothetical protein
MAQARGEFGGSDLESSVPWRDSIRRAKCRGGHHNRQNVAAISPELARLRDSGNRRIEGLGRSEVA